MKNKLTFLSIVILFCAIGFHSCKKDIINDSTEELSGEAAKASKWYNQQIIPNTDNREFINQNKPQWNRLISDSIKGRKILAIPIYQSIYINRELNINIIDNDYFGAIKEYNTENKDRTILKIYSLNGRFLEQGLLNSDGKYLKTKTGLGNTITLMGGEFTWVGTNYLSEVIIPGTGPSIPPVILPPYPYFPPVIDNGGTGGPGGPGSGDGPTDIIIEFKNFPCAQSLAAKMLTLKDKVTSLINKNFSHNDMINVILSAYFPLEGTSTDGRLLSRSGSNYRIGINPDVLNNSTQEYMLATIYHEILHAYIADRLRVLGKTEFDKQFLGLQVNGGRLLGVQNTDHWPMGYFSFVYGIKDAILALNPSFDPQRALIIAKSGIIELSEKESKINEQERDAQNPGSQGTKCP